MIGNSIAGFLGEGVAVSGSSFESIATVTAAGGETSLTFSSISQDYSSLQLRWIWQMGNAGATGLWIRPNGVSSASYAYHQLFGNGATANASKSINSSLGMIVASLGYDANYKNVGIFDLIDYASTTKYKTGKAFSGIETNTTDGTSTVRLQSGLFMSTSAVTSLTLYANTDTFGAGSTFALYGIKG